MNKLWMAISVSLLGHILAWFHMQAQFKWTWASNTWWIAIGGNPISYAFFYGTKWYYDFLETIGMSDLLDLVWQQ